MKKLKQEYEHIYENSDIKEAYSPIGSENEIESQLPQMKSLVMDPKTPPSCKGTERKNLEYDQFKIGIFFKIIVTGIDNEVDDFKSNLFTKFNKFSNQDQISRNNDNNQIGKSKRTQYSIINKCHFLFL